MQISWLDSVQRRAGPLALKENAPELQKVRGGKKRRKVDAFTQTQEIGVRVE
jgi:hypothetical protein